MNRTIRNLVIAVPLATVGFTMVNTAAAVAGPNGPVIITTPEDDDPYPHPKPQPFDNDLPLADAPKPKDPKPQPKPKPAAQPQADNQFAPAAVETAKAPKKVAEVISAKGSPDSIDRSDVQLAAGPAETTLEVTESDNGMDLTWLLVGGGIVTASGIAFAARKRANA